MNILSMPDMRALLPAAKVIQEGKESGQGVAYLSDGTMIVVDAAAQYIDQSMEVQVTRVLQTAAGCIIFAQRKRE